ncbi:MAG TPA: efflux RND transporter periplasmic adaptor subunit [Bryobacteraceae bacterium]|nr:efflux RND transporter periplasmic adaptor subunit [Bryobacteraceae bacterium]
MAILAVSVGTSRPVYTCNPNMLLRFTGPLRRAAIAFLGVACLLLAASCGRKTSSTAEAASDPGSSRSTVTVGVAKVTKRPLQRELTVSSELVPFQEIDVYAKEAGYVKQLLVDYGSHVKQGQLMAVLEIPELEALLRQDEAAVKSMEDQVTNATHQLGRIEAQHKVVHLQYQRLNGVAQKQPGLVAQQEVDDVQGRDLAAEAQVEAAKSALEAAKSNLAESEAKLTHDQAIYSYTRITAPFAGVVTQRYANLGTLMQAGTNSSTSVLPLVKLSEESKYRLVIPIPESYVAYIKVGDPVNVRVPSLGKSFPGKVARFAEEVRDATRTMHTEVDVPNPTGELIPGLYASATLTLNRTGEALAVPVQAVDRESEPPTVLIVDPSNQIQRREILLGVETENYAEVLSGLKVGDEVVVGDRAGLNPGLTVHPQVVAPAAY